MSPCSSSTGSPRGGVAKPRVGERRVYEGLRCPVIYPGEIAFAEFEVEAVASAFALTQAGLPMSPIEPVRWVVEPSPGVVAWVRRWRYRLWGQWWEARDDAAAMGARADR